MAEIPRPHLDRCAHALLTAGRPDHLRVLTALRIHPRDALALAERLDVTPAAAATVLRNLHAAALAAEVSPGVYGPTPEGIAVLAVAVAFLPGSAATHGKIDRAFGLAEARAGSFPEPETESKTDEMPFFYADRLKESPSNAT